MPLSQSSSHASFIPIRPLCSIFPFLIAWVPKKHHFPIHFQPNNTCLFFLFKNLITHRNVQPTSLFLPYFLSTCFHPCLSSLLSISNLVKIFSKPFSFIPKIKYYLLFYSIYCQTDVLSFFATMASDFPPSPLSFIYIYIYLLSFFSSYIHFSTNLGWTIPGKINVTPKRCHLFRKTAVIQHSVMKFDRSNKFDLFYYGQVNSLWLKLSVTSKWTSKHLYE